VSTKLCPGCVFSWMWGGLNPMVIDRDIEWLTAGRLIIIFVTGKPFISYFVR